MFRKPDLLRGAGLALLPVFFRQRMAAASVSEGESLFGYIPINDLTFREAVCWSP